ncbi:MAG: SDR family NAD(P)-dependent oxidoreductase, partial [bacterium]
MKLFDLTGKAAIVTGGNGGIGLGMAQGLAEAGASVMIAARNAEKSEAAVQSLVDAGGKAAHVTVDVTDEAAVQKMVEETESRFGRVDILVNNAGTNLRKMPQEYTLEEWHMVMDTNLTSAFLCSKACYPAFKRAGGGKILNNG